MNEQTTQTTKRGRGCLGTGLRILGLLVIVLIVLGIAGAIFESSAENAVRQEFPAPGQMVTVEGRALHIQCLGEGSPTIVLDAGQGGWSSDWANIMPQLSQENRVCAYDRAGYGWSDPAKDERSPQDAADDLAALLNAANIEGPYLLVAFSHSGLGARIFAAQHSEQMAGLVLVDPSTEFDSEILGPELMQQQRSAVGMFQGFGLAARVGLIRLLGPENMAGSAPFIGTDPADPTIYYTFVADPQWWETSTREFVSGLNDEHMELVRQEGTIQDIPLVIIGSDVLDASGNPALTAVQKARHDMLQQLAAQSDQGEFIIAEGSTHQIISDRPDTVVEAIQTVLTAGE